jgi:DUF4097 and DUF4098 domain-containing protein YvlB
MQRNNRFVTWTGAILGMFMALALNAALAHASDNDEGAVIEEFHQTYPLTANGRVELENINGSVHIAVWDQNQLKLDAVKRAHNQEQLKDSEIRVDSRADSISIQTKYRERDKEYRYFEGRNNPASVEYTLTVPRNARLDEIKLINGHLDVTGVTGEVRASCINGKLTARGLANQVRLATINGPLDAVFDRVPSNTIDLSSVNGPVQLTLPSDSKATIEATTVHGGIENDFGLHSNDHQFVGHNLRGELGGGGARIRVNNVNGTIDVRHATDGHALSPAKDLGKENQEDDI